MVYPSGQHVPELTPKLVATPRVEFTTDGKDNYYIAAPFLAPYKRLDLVVEAFNRMPSRRLLVVGEGQQSPKLRALAGPNIEFAGYLRRQDYIAADIVQPLGMSAAPTGLIFLEQTSAEIERAVEQSSRAI